MADVKISGLPAATTPLAGTEVLPIVQSSATKKVAANDLTVKNVRSNATTGILQVIGPGTGTTRVMTTPNADFTAARTDAAQTFTGDQTFSGKVLQSKTTLAGYQWNSWNPSDVSGTSTNAPSTGNTDDSDFVTLANSSGTLTITFDVAGKYLVCIQSNTTHANVYTFDRLITALGGTATRRTNVDTPQNSGDSANDSNFSITTSFYVSATAAQTLTILPTYELTGGGTTAQHTAFCSVTVLYCGG